MLVDAQVWEKDEQLAAVEYLLDLREPLLMVKSDAESAGASPAQ